MRRQFHLSAVILAAFFCILCTFPKEVQAVFMDEKTFSADLSLQLGMLSMTLENQSTTSQSFAYIGENQVHNVKVKNTGTLDGKLTYSIVSAKLGDQVLSEAQIAQYLAIDSPTQKESIKSGEERTLQFSIKQMKQWDSTKPLIVEVKVTISQANTDSDTIGFLDSDNVQFSFKSASEAVPISSWPESLTFNQAGYAVGQQLYYSSVNNQMTTVVPGIIYYQFKTGSKLTQNEQLEEISNIKAKVSALQGNNYIVDKIAYIENKGFVILLRVQSSTGSMAFQVKGIQFNQSGSEIYDFGKPLIIESDVLNNAFVDHSLLSSQVGTKYQMFSITTTNTFESGLSDVNIEKYLHDNYTIEFSGEDKEEFDVTFPTSSTFSIKQLHDQADKSANLIFKDKKTNQIVFSRKVESIEQDDFSTIYLSNLSSDFQYKVIVSKKNYQNNLLEYTSDLYMKIPKNFLVNYYMQSFLNDNGLSNWSVTYSDDMKYLKISFNFSVESVQDPENFYYGKNISFIGYKYGIGRTGFYPYVVLYNKNLAFEQNNQTAKVSSDSLQSQKLATSTDASDTIDSNELKQSESTDSSETTESTTNESIKQSSETSSGYQPDASTTESSEPTTNQTEPSQEPE